MWWVLVGGVALVVAGVVAIVLGRSRSRDASGFLAVAQPARARVVGMETEPLGGDFIHDRARHSAFFPVVEFHLPDGQLVRARTLYGAKPKPARIDDLVDVVYDPADPRRVALTTGLARPGAMGWAFPAIGGWMIGLGLVFIGLWFLITRVFDIPV